MSVGDTEGLLTAVEVDEEDPLEVFVVDEHRMASRARLVVDGEVAPVRVPPKHVVLLLVYYQFLKETACSNVQKHKREEFGIFTFVHLCLWSITQQCHFPLRSLNIRAHIPVAPFCNRVAKGFHSETQIVSPR